MDTKIQDLVQRIYSNCLKVDELNKENRLILSFITGYIEGEKVCTEHKVSSQATILGGGDLQSKYNRLSLD